MEKFRNELKYLVSDEEMLLIENRVNKAMKPDVHAKDGKYKISSLYFDDYEDSCLYDVASGVDKREKYRLRFYDGDPGKISLESKFKSNGSVLKRIVPLDAEEAQSLIEGRFLRNVSQNDPLKCRFTYDMMSKGLHPVVIVEYERIPYVYGPGNVRITFDRNIVSSADVRNFTNGYRLCRPVMETGSQILEVKYDDLLPPLIYDLINIGDLQQISASKYSLCRRYGI